MAGPGPQLGFSAECELLDFRLQALSTGTPQVRRIWSSGGRDWASVSLSVKWVGVMSATMSTACAQQASGNEKM